MASILRRLVTTIRPRQLALAIAVSVLLINVWTISRSPRFKRYASRASEKSFLEDELAALREVFDFLEHPTAHCANLTRLGGRQYPEGGHDGDKMACLDRPLTLGQPGCLVYSIGINNEWSFDRAAAALGCEVHSFDPSMKDQAEGRFEPGITFHRIGIGRNNHTSVDGWSILVLDHLMASLGHRRRTIQYLKADAEGGEMDMLIDQLVDLKSMYRMFVLDRVEQLGLELHMRLLPEREAAFYREVRAVFRQLRRLGFDVVHSEPNQIVPERYRFPGVDRPVSLLYEVLLVRRRRAAPHFDANVHYPCGSKERCDLIDGVKKSVRAVVPGT
ncbi:Methyltransferase-like protein 24 [Amphibalanus amphitrite]|uniref:Methyltransferase-like protein 24 n=1 Tax=Amphibalanus amphitrite TaxID=1232801 RepID=A0A6A4X0C4_AMPAM|nr:Methyltransferase-like protein 24 [Amphibalanus amphitrite]